MKNKDMPAMPQVITESSHGCRLIGSHMEDEWQGVTKREMFAMNAPDIPDWFKYYWESKNSNNTDDKIDSRYELLPKGQMARLKAGRYAYADMMLED